MQIHLGENARMALATIREHKMRSFLTVLGVVIGVTTGIAVISILVGLDRDVRETLNDYGTDTLFVFKFNPGIHTGRLTEEERTRKPITLEDALAIQELCPSVKRVAAHVFPRVGSGLRRQVTARYHNKEVFNIDHAGTLATAEEVYSQRMDRGRFFTEAEDLHRADLAVIGYDLAQALFPAENPMGKSILVGGVSYEVIGVQARHKGQFFRDESNDLAVLVPYRSYRKHNPNDDEHYVGVLAYPGRKAAAEDEIRGLLRRRRNVPYDKADNFGISSAEQIASEFRQITGAIALLIFVISSIGLLVGGVGVMNIMLMSVTQRTREIGVRKAIGARRRDIVWQFLTEAMTLTGAGGRHWSGLRHQHQPAGQLLPAAIALDGAALGRAAGRAGGHERRLVLWNVSRRQGGAPRSR